MTQLVVLTQAAEGSDSLVRQVAAAGLEVEHWPLVRLAPVPHETGRSARELQADAMRRAISIG